MTTATKNDIIEFGGYDEVDEGFPKVASQRYLGKVTEATVEESKAGNPYLAYAVTIIEPREDKRGLEVKGLKIRGMMSFVTNAVDGKTGMVRTPEQLDTSNRRMRGQARKVIRTISGEDFTPSGTIAEVVQAAADQIKGAKVVVLVGLQKSEEFGDKNIIREHRSEDTWDFQD